VTEPQHLAPEVALERLLALEERVEELARQLGAEHDAQVVIAGAITLPLVIEALKHRAAELAAEKTAGSQDRAARLARLIEEITEATR